ncbi:hypothetical protein, partial [Thiolapillus sp.]|uniref:hypothetical protein n=1 Tax=Thiolapillus sp. TaxID=2017437 RepID=UPI003AF65767
MLLRTWLPYDWTPRSEAYFVFPLAQGTPGKQCCLAATGVYQPSLRSPWLAAKEVEAPTFHMDSAAHSGTGARNRPIFQENWRSPLWLMCFKTRWRQPISEVICWKKDAHSCRRGPTTALENQCPDTLSICFFCCRSFKKVYLTVPSSHDKVASLSTHFGLSLLRGVCPPV